MSASESQQTVIITGAGSGIGSPRVATGRRVSPRRS
jgi:NADP-dependent 3-hydroxy acid dehydrogenase YdfG